MKLGEFKKVAQEQSAFGVSNRRGSREVQNSYSPEVLADLEKKFWRNILFNPPMYGADCPVPKGPSRSPSLLLARRPLSALQTDRWFAHGARLPGGRAWRAFRPARVRGLGPGAAGEPADDGAEEEGAGRQHALPLRRNVQGGLRVALRGHGPPQHQLRPLRRPKDVVGPCVVAPCVVAPCFRAVWWRQVT